MTRARDRSYLPDVSQVERSLKVRTLSDVEEAETKSVHPGEQSHELSDDDVLDWLTANRYFSAAAVFKQERYAKVVNQAAATAAQQIAQYLPEQRQPTLREVFAFHVDYDEAVGRGLVY